MCGITGFIGYGDITGGARASLARAMADTLRHRGPDDGGLFIDEPGQVAFGHRRLKIIDLSEAARQPMVSADGRFAICYNGEIYNFRALRQELVAAGLTLRSQSDTEVLLEWIARWGVVSALDHAEGIFAFALWDRRAQRLWLVRDPLGVKPLYWTRLDDGLLFASELKAFTCFPRFRPAIDTQALQGYLRYGYISAPRTVFQGVQKLLPGHLLTVGAAEPPEVHRYWNAAAGFAEPSSAASEDELREELLQLVRRSVRQEMIADVPVGVFLSGGIDSSLIAAIARDATAGPLNTFSIAVDDAAIDESRYAAAVAQHLGTVHSEVRLSSAAASDAIRELPQIYDEPLSDMAQIPTRLISAAAREKVTVVLSGDGGDELFAGYQRYYEALAFYNRLSRLPTSLAAVGGRMLRALQPILLSAAERTGGAGLRAGRLAHFSHRLSDLLSHHTPLDIYVDRAALWSDPPTVADPDLDDPLRHAAVGQRCRDEVGLFQLIDTLTYLPDAILTKLDRASMAVSLEARVPLLNRRIVEFAQRLPADMRWRDGVSKRLLRDLLYGLIPRALVDRPKQGFGVPMAGWLRGPLRDWADDLLSPASLAETGLLRADPIVKRWSQHRAGNVDWSYSLWAVLVFVDWWRAWRSAANQGMAAEAHVTAP